jgi:Mce-associated membrane protein
MTRVGLPDVDDVGLQQDEADAVADEQDQPEEPIDDLLAESSDSPTKTSSPAVPRFPRRAWLIVFGLLPAVCIVLGGAAGYFHWQKYSASASRQAQIDATQSARDATVAMLSYRPDTVDKDLGAAAQRLTGNFKDSYLALVHDVVIPGAKQGSITAIANVPAMAPVSIGPHRAVILLFVDQTLTIGSDPPTDTSSSVRVTLDKVDGHWLVSQFDPV